MLQFRCPNLEELVIGSTTLEMIPCRRKFNVLSLLGATWPKLRLLNLEQAEFYTGKDPEDFRQQNEKILSFLVSMPSLQQATGLSDHISSLLFPDDSGFVFLHQITVSTYQIQRQIESVSVRQVTLQELDLRMPEPNGLDFWSNVPVGALRAVGTLTLRFTLAQIDFATIQNGLFPRRLRGDHAETIQAALQFFPELLHLRIMCETDSDLTFNWVSTAIRDSVVTRLTSPQADLIPALRGSKLQSLQVHKLEKDGDPHETNMADVAAQLAVAYSSLESIMLRSMSLSISRALFCTVTHGGTGVPWRVGGQEWCRTSSGKFDSRRISRDLCAHG